MHIPTSNGTDSSNMVVVLDNRLPTAISYDDLSMEPATSMLQSQIAATPSLMMGSPHNKDSRWLTLEVCREFQRGKCARTEQECKFAHPPPHVESNNGTVIACFDNLKGRCQRVNPPCKYLHPPQHLKDILQQNGRNNLILRSLNMNGGHFQSPMNTPLYRNQVAMFGGGGAFLAAPNLGHSPFAAGGTASPMNGSTTFFHALTSGAAPVQFAYATAPNALTAMMARQNQSPYSTPGCPTFFTINPAFGGAAGIPINIGSQFANHSPMFDPSFQSAFYNNQGIYPGNLMPNGATYMPNLYAVRPQNSTPTRTDRLEVCADFQQGVCMNSSVTCNYAHPPAHCPIDTDGLVTVCVDYVKGKCTRDSCKYFHPPDHLVSKLKSFSNPQMSNYITEPNNPYPTTLFCSPINPATNALANRRFVTGMMLSGANSPAAMQHSINIQASNGLFPAGGLIFTPTGSQTPHTGMTTFFPSGAHIITNNRGTQSLQARPTMISVPRQLIGALTYLPSKRPAIDDLVSSAAKKRTYDEAKLQRQLKSDQTFQNFKISSSTNSNVSSTSVQTVTSIKQNTDHDHHVTLADCVINDENQPNLRIKASEQYTQTNFSTPLHQVQDQYKSIASDASSSQYAAGINKM